MHSGKFGPLEFSRLHLTDFSSALASLEDRDNMATSPPSNPTSPLMSKSQPAVERRPSKTPSKDGEEAS
jgi:translation initiation factor 4G